MKRHNNTPPVAYVRVLLLAVKLLWLRSSSFQFILCARKMREREAYELRNSSRRQRSLDIYEVQCECNAIRWSRYSWWTFIGFGSFYDLEVYERLKASRFARWLTRGSSLIASLFPSVAISKPFHQQIESSVFIRLKLVWMKYCA